MAWKVNRDAGTTSPPYFFSNYMTGGHWGNAENWDTNAVTLGYRVDKVPAIGAIAHWNAADLANPSFPGHVAYVERVNSDGTVDVSEYNYSAAHGFGYRQNVSAPRYIHVSPVLQGTADLLPKSITLSSSTPAPGTDFTANWTLANIGAAAANAASTTVVRITASSTSGAGTNAASVSTAALGASTSVAQSATLTAPTAPGTYYVWVVADNGSAVTNQGANTGNDLQHSAAFTVSANVPSAPQNLAVSPGNTQNVLTWNAPASSGGGVITGYRVFRGTSNSSLTIVNSGSCANLGVVYSCTDTGLTNGQTYYYVVSAVNSFGQGNPSTTIPATPAAAAVIPGAFTLASAMPGCNGSSPQINLNWTVSGGVTTYDVYRDSALYSPGVPADTLSFLNKGTLVTPGATYTYFVRARNATGTRDSGPLTATAPSNCGTTAAIIPGVPSNLRATAGDGQNSLTWLAPLSDGGVVITKYRVFRGTNSANVTLVTAGGCANPGVTPACTDTGLTNGQSYYYIVSAVNSVGQGDASNSATATPAAVVLSLSGYVYDTTSGIGLADVLVKIGTINTNTNASGRYSVSNLTNTSYTIQASRSGYATSNTTSINPATTSTFNFVLSADSTACVAGTVSGIVTDATTRTPKGEVAVRLSNGASTTTDGATGTYSFANVAPGPVTVSINATGYTAYSQASNICGNKKWDVALTTNATAQGLNVQSALSKDPVNTATGNYIYQHSDLSLPGIGLAFSFERGYNSQAASDASALSGPLGFGWSHSYNTYLTVASGNVTVNLGDGKTESYAPNGAGGFTAQYGVFDTLSANTGGTYSLTRKDRTTYNFDVSNRLASIVDKNGNTVLMGYSSSMLTRITDTAGRNIGLSYDASNRITKITDPIGRTVQFTYDAAGNLATAQDANGNITAYVYDAYHQMTSVTDPRGNVLVTNVYDVAKRVVNSQRDAKNGQTTYVYDPANHKTTLTDAMGNVTVDYHDTLLRLIRQDDAKGNSTHYEYDAAGNRISVTDKMGKLTSYSYDALGNVTSKTDAFGKTSSVTYDGSNNPLTRTDALGNVTRFAYDAKGNLLSVRDALNNTASNTYNSAGQVLTTTDARSNVTTNTYDARGNLIQVTDALGNYTFFSYDGAGRRLTRSDALNRTTTYAYDSNDNLLSTTDPYQKSITATYDGNNNRLSFKDKRGNATRFAYDVKDLLSSTTDALSKTVVNAYDALDRKTSVTDKNNNITQFAYDGAGNLTNTTDALSQLTQFAFDANGNRLSVTDPLGHVSRFTYDALNRQVIEQDPLGNQTQTIYDDLGRAASVTNAKNQLTVLSYDKIGRLIQVTDANGGTLKYGYDANGNRTSMIDPNGHVTSYAYNALNRLITKTEPLGAVRYQYDAVGNRTQVTKANGAVIGYAYDNLDRLQSITYPDAGTVTFSYDFDGNRTSMTDSLGSAGAQYDALSRMTAYTDAFSQTVSYGYDANSNRTSIVYPGNKAVAYVFDPLNRMSRVTDWITYNYDAAGRLTSSINPNGVTTIYGFDDANRMTSVSHSAGANTVASYAYTLDQIGNHKQVTQTEPLPQVMTPGTVNYAYDAENRQSSINGVANTFDLNGNMTAKGSNTYAYDFEDRLKQVTIGGTSSQYQYDGLGRRYARTSAGTTTRYVLDLNGNLSKVLMETNTVGAVSAYYIYGLGLVSRISSAGTSSYYHFDSRGSTIAITDGTGNVTDKYAYDPFGKISNSQGATLNPFKYVGQFGVMDEGNGLYYIRARYYDAQIGRFINKDPKAGNDKDGQSLNRYAYASNNPVRFVDVSGYTKTEVPSKAGCNSVWAIILGGNYDGCSSAQIDERMATLNTIARVNDLVGKVDATAGFGIGCALTGGLGGAYFCGETVKSATESLIATSNVINKQDISTSVFVNALGEKWGSRFDAADAVVGITVGTVTTDTSRAGLIGTNLFNMGYGMSIWQYLADPK